MEDTDLVSKKCSKRCSHIGDFQKCIVPDLRNEKPMLRNVLKRIKIDLQYT